MDDASIVANTIEANFDAATLFAFHRASEAASVNITHTIQVNIWSYDPKVLFILIQPLIATILVLATRWKIFEDDVVIGYNPVAIAQRAEEILAHLPATSAHSDQEADSKSTSPRCNYSTVSSQQIDEISLETLGSSERRTSNQTLRPTTSEETGPVQSAGAAEDIASIEQAEIVERRLV